LPPPGPLTAIAQQVRLTDPEWHAPILWRSELRSILTGTEDKAVLRAFPEKALSMSAFIDQFA
jgi:hypothetical protein